jgi:hypothetical protein
MASNRYHPEGFPTHSFDILLAPADGGATVPDVTDGGRAGENVRL